MSTQLVKGQKAKLADLAPGADALDAALLIVPGSGETIDVSCFGLNADGKLADDRYFIFYNQKRSPCGGLESVGPRGADGETFALELSRLPATINRLVFTATLDGTGSMAGLRPSRWQLRARGGSAPVATFSFSGADFGAEKAIMVAEIYRKDGVWRVTAIGQGFNGGLSALLKHFGGEEIAPPSPTAPPLPVIPPPPPPTPAAAPTVNLKKVTLEKQGARKTVSLKKGGGLQPIAVNLNWDRQEAGAKTGGGFFGFGGGASSKGADLDLGCLFELRDGDKGVIQPLGGNFGSRTGPPFIFLDKDDRSGASSDGENLTIFRPDLIKRVVVFAMIYEGAANFSDVNGRLTLREQDGSEILVRLNNPDSRSPFCAICLIQRVGDGVEVVKEERYYAGHRFADEHYGFGFQWTRGSK